ncbi:MAG: hypothetical protein N4A61_14740 [Pelagimonas sp.]|nr:hypothetical protein [Pelagimonas sp.]
MTSIFTPPIAQPLPFPELRPGAKPNWTPPVQDAPLERQGFTPSASVSDTNPTSVNPAPVPLAVQGKADPETARPSAVNGAPSGVSAALDRPVPSSAPAETQRPNTQVPSPAHANPAHSGQDAGPSVQELAFAPQDPHAEPVSEPADAQTAQVAYRTALETTNAAEPAQLLMTA